MEPNPLSSNEKALAVSVLVVGGLIAIFTVASVGAALFTIATGKVAGGEMSQALTKGMRDDPKLQELMKQQLAAQAEVQQKWAPLQLASEGLYLTTLLGCLVFAVVALKGFGRKRLGQLAALAAVVRVGVGIVTYLLTTELMRATTSSVFAAVQTGSKGLSAEKAENMQRLFKGAMAGLSAASSGCLTLVVCGYLGVVAYVFGLPKKEPSAPER